jgi:hypothetical protein
MKSTALPYLLLLVGQVAPASEPGPFGLVFFPDDFVPPGRRASGLVVRYVAPGSRAAAAGCQKYDGVLSVNGKAVRPTAVALELQHEQAAGRCPVLGVIRNDKKLTLRTTCTSQDAPIDRAKMLEDAEHASPIIEVRGVSGLQRSFGTFEVNPKDSLRALVDKALANVSETVFMCVAVGAPGTSNPKPPQCARDREFLGTLPMDRSYLVVVSRPQADGGWYEAPLDGGL